MTDLATALARAQAGWWNSSPYHVTTNPGGLEVSEDGLTEGHILNFPEAVYATGLLAQYAGTQAAAATASATTASAAAGNANTSAGIASAKADQAAAARDQTVAIAATVAPLGSSLPAGLGTAAAGAATTAAHSDHVHAMPTAAQVGAAAASHAHAIGDTAGLQTALDGKLAQGKHTIWVPAAAMTARTTSGAAAGTVETATNKVMKKTLDFDAAATEYAQFTVAMPKSWNEGTISFQALWTAASGSGGVVFALQGLAVSDLDNLDAAFGAAQTVTDALGTAGYLHQTSESAAITVAGSPAEGDLAIFQLHRDVAHASDTLAVDAQLLGVRLFYTVNAGNDA